MGTTTHIILVYVFVLAVFLGISLVASLVMVGGKYSLASTILGAVALSSLVQNLK